MGGAVLRDLLFGAEGHPSVGWLLMGVLAAIPVGGLVWVLDRLLYTDAVILFVIVVAIGGLAAIVVAGRGGLTGTWFAILPLLYVLLMTGSRSSGADLIVGAPVLTFVVGTIAYAIGRTVRDVRWARRSTGGGPRAPATERDEDPTGTPDERSAMAPTDGQSDTGTTWSPPVGRRTLLFAAGGGVTILGAGVGHAYGWWCETSPADVAVRNHTNRNVALQVTVRRRGLEVFQAEPEVGIMGPRRGDAPVGNPQEVQYDDVIPIGCSMPEDITVEVHTDTGIATTDVVTFPKPDPPSGRDLRGSTLHVDVYEDDVALEPRYAHTGVA